MDDGMITYSLNWMGPVSMDWYRQRGLTITKTVTLEEDSTVLNRRAGENYEFEEIITHYSCGRIDVCGTDDPYGDEIGVPPMLSEDWARFSLWLDSYKTQYIHTLDQLTLVYELTNPKIRWAVNDN